MSKTYRQLREELADFVSNSMFGTKSVPVYKNPMHRELRDIAKGEFKRTSDAQGFISRVTPTGERNKVPLRGFFTQDLELYLWHGEGGNHTDVKKSLTSRNDVMFISGFYETIGGDVHLVVRNEGAASDFVFDYFEDDPEIEDDENVFDAFTQIASDKFFYIKSIDFDNSQYKVGFR